MDFVSGYSHLLARQNEMFQVLVGVTNPAGKKVRKI